MAGGLQPGVEGEDRVGEVSLLGIAIEPIQWRAEIEQIGRSLFQIIPQQLVRVILVSRRMVVEDHQLEGVDSFGRAGPPGEVKRYAFVVALGEEAAEIGESWWKSGNKQDYVITLKAGVDISGNSSNSHRFEQNW